VSAAQVIIHQPSLLTPVLQLFASLPQHCVLSVTSNSTVCVRYKASIQISFERLQSLQQQVIMVAFSRITFALAVAGLSSAQSLSVPAPSGLPSEFPSGAFPSGAARPTGGFGGNEGGRGHGGHGGDHSGFAHPTGGFQFGGPKPSGTGVVGAQRAQQSGEAPFPSGGDFSAFPSGAARPSGHHSHHGQGGKGGNHSGAPPSGAVPSGAAPTATPSGLERRQQPSGTPPVFSGSFPAPSGGFPSGGFPAPSGGFPSGGFPESGAPFPTGAGFSGFPSGVAHPSGHHGHHGKGGKGDHSGAAPSGPAPTGAPSVAPSGLERRQEPSGTPPAFSGSFSGPAPSGPKPTGPIPSGIAPPNGARPSGHPSGPVPSGSPPARPSGAAENNVAAIAAKSGSSEKPTGVRPTGARPTGARPSGKPSGPAPSGARPTGPPPSGKPSGPAPTGFVTSTVRGA
jgi:hypothetical protein